MIFGREPALWGALLRALVVLLTTFFMTWTTDQQGAINAVVAAITGVLVAVAVQRDKMVPALLGLAEAAVVGTAAWGWNLPPDRQAVIMAVAAATVAVITRDRVVAPVDEVGNPRPRV